MGNWSVVQSRKRKATELEQTGSDVSRGSDGQRGAATGNIHDRQHVFDRVSKDGYHDRKFEGTRVNNIHSNNSGARVAIA